MNRRSAWFQASSLALVDGRCGPALWQRRQGDFTSFEVEAYAIELVENYAAGRMIAAQVMQSGLPERLIRYRLRVLARDWLRQNPRHTRDVLVLSPRTAVRSGL
jgi:hypothetical protein